MAAPNDGTFLLGPAQLTVKEADGGLSRVGYASVKLHQPGDLGSDAPGLEFTALDGSAFPEGASAVYPIPSMDPYPVDEVSEDGSRMTVTAPNEGIFSPGPGRLRVKLTTGVELSYPYAFLASGGHGRLTFEAPRGASFPSDASFAGPMQVAGTEKAHHATAPPPVVWAPDSRGARSFGEVCHLHCGARAFAVLLRKEIHSRVSARPSTRCALCLLEMFQNLITVLMELPAGGGASRCPERQNDRGGAVAMIDGAQGEEKLGVLCPGKHLYSAGKVEALISHVPPELSGRELVLTSGEKSASGSTLSMVLKTPCFVYILWDMRWEFQVIFFINLVFEPLHIFRLVSTSAPPRG